MRRWGVVLAALALVTTACGSRRSHDDVVAAARGNLPSGLTGVEAGTAGATDVVTEAGAATDSNLRQNPTQSGSASVAGSGRGATSAAGGSGPAQAVAAGSKSVIRIGSVGTLSGPAGNNLKPQTDGVRVWVRWINDRGGLNGHPVELAVGDDGGDPARHRSLVQEFVEQRNVIAFVGNPEALTGASSVEYLTKTGVPVIGSEAAGQWFYESPVYFPQSSHGDALSQGTQAVGSVELKKRGLTKVGVIACVEVQICRDAYDKAPRQYAKVGMQVVYRAQASFGQPDYTAECLNAQSAGAQIIAMAMDGNSVTRIAASCARQGFRPVYSYTNGIALPQHRTDPNLQGSVVPTPVAPWIYGGTPATKEFQDAMARYAPGTEVQGGHMPGWVAAKVFERGGGRLGEPATRPALLEGLWAIHGDVMPELTGPLLYNKGRPATPTACAFAVTIKDSRWVAINDAKRECTEFDPNL